MFPTASRTTQIQITMKAKFLPRCLLAASLTGAFLGATPTAHANDWTGGVGSWADPLNWNGGVPNNAGGWAIGNVQNGGTAIISSAVPNVSEMWAGNGGGAGNIIVTNGGAITVDNWVVVSRMYESGVATPLSTLIVNNGSIIKNGNWGDSQFVVGDAYNGVGAAGQAFLAGTGYLQINGGAFRIAPGNSQGTVTVQDQGHLSFTPNAPSWFGIGQEDGSAVLHLKDQGWIEMGTCDFNAGDSGNGRGRVYMSDSARLDVRRFWLGKFDSSAGALWQTGGAITGLSGGNDWCLGGENTGAVNSYGYYNLAGGSLVVPNNFQIGRYGKGVIYQTGGSLSASSWTTPGRFPGSLGVIWVSGGTFAHTGGSTQLIIGEEGRGEFTVSGSGTLDCNLNLRMTNPGGSGVLNVNAGGTVAVPGIAQSGSSGILNFNGGTVKAKASNPNFINGLAEARVYGGHAIFDTDGNDVTVAQPLYGAVGDGVLSIQVDTAGAGYLAPPIVQFDGGGTGATAVAQVDPTAGTVTNILVTCPGYYYFSAPTITLVGGAPTTVATVGTPVLGPVASGGVVKQGAGTLTLTGASDYTGPTTVSAGRLITTTDPYGAGSVTVADGAAYGVRPSYLNAQLQVSSLTLASSTAATLEFDLGSHGNPGLAPLNVNGNLALNGAIAVNIEDALPQLGQIPLLAYSSISGAGSFVLGSLPAGVQATISHDTVAKVLYLTITGVGLPRWDGQDGGNWDIGITTNWIELSTGLPTQYSDGMPALFNDDAFGTTTVNLTTTVQPSGVTVTNSVQSYTLTGAGKLSGSTTLTKGGSASFTIANTTPNDYTGPTTIAGGTLSVTNLANGGVASAIGASTAAANNLVLAGGTLSYSGPATTIDRGYRNTAAGSTLNTSGDLTLSGPITAGLGSGLVKAGPAKLTLAGLGTMELSGGGFPGVNIHDGTLVFDGSAGGQVMHSQNELWIGGSALSSAALTLMNTTLNVDSWFAVGRGLGTVGNTATVHLYDSALRTGAASMGYDGNIAGNLSSQAMTLHGSSTFTNNGDMNLGESAGSSSHLYLNDTSKYYNGSRVHCGWHNNATGAITLAQSAAMTVNAWLAIGHEGGDGTFTMKDNSSLWVLWDLNVTDVGTGNGNLVMQDSARAEAGAVFVAKGEASTGTATIAGTTRLTANSYFVANSTNAVGVVHQTGGTVIARPGGDVFQIGANGAGAWNLHGGSVLISNHWTAVGRYPAGSGVLNVTSGSFQHNDPTRRLIIGEEGNGIVTVSGSGLVSSLGDQVPIAAAATSTSELNLNGGTFIARRILGGLGVSTLNLNGGLLQAGANANPDFVSGLTAANILASGATIDVGTQNLAITQALLDGGGNGGLTKLGTGTLALMGVNTYTGPTVVSVGALAGTGTLAGAVTVAAGAALAPGTSIGTLTVSGALTLQADSTTFVEVSKTAGTSDQVAGTASVAYGGTLVLKNLAGQLAVGDTFTVFPNGTRTGTFASVLSETPGQTVTWDTSRLTIDGTVKVATAATVPVSLTPVVSDGQMTLSWPASQIGWELQMQTNPLSVGLDDNWVPVPGSTETNTVTLPIGANPGVVFFRLVFP
jgi:autotransporter-associated beta strand protein